MTARVIDGKAIASQMNEETRYILADQDIKPRLAIILANNNDASRIYIARKIDIGQYVGIDPILIECPKHWTTQNIITKIEELNNDPEIHGIFIQLPTFAHLNHNDIINAIDPRKDVDGLTITNMGKLLSSDDSGLVPCTPQGVMDMFRHEKIELSGRRAVIIGRSLLFGKPMGQLLLNADCTVTQCHSKTVDLPSITRQADILIAAVGQPNMVKADWVKDGAIVIDVGINRMDDGTLSGDVDFDAVSKIANAITPVPGGVGPMTVACLLGNTVRACQNIRQSD